MFGDQRMIFSLESASSSSSAPVLGPSEEHASGSRKLEIESLEVVGAQKGEQTEGLANRRSKKNKVAGGSGNPKTEGWCSETQDADQNGETNTSELISPIERELAITCLLYTPQSYYGVIACLNQSFCSIVRSGELYKLRREARIVEHMIYCSCNVLEWDGFDPCRQRWFSIPSMRSHRVLHGCR